MNFFDLFHFYFWERDVFFKTNGVVSLAIKTFVGNTMEIAHARERHIDQPLEKLIHARSAKRHHDSNFLSFTNLKVGNRLLGFGAYWFLTGDLRESFLDILDKIRFFYKTTDPRVHYHLGYPRNFHNIFVS